MDVRSKVIIQSIMSEPDRTGGGRGVGGVRATGQITAGWILLPTVMPTL